MKSVIVLGFGRSGTTWLADVISRLLGPLILFEPLHPSVTERSEELSYRRVTNDRDGAWLKEYIQSVLEKRHRKPWLMRNHVPAKIDEINPRFLDYLWQECVIGGFKEIRMNLSIPWLVQQGFGAILFVIRDPRAVVASVLNRSNFWEFGWPGTYELFVNNVLDDPAFIHHPVQALADFIRSAQLDFERITILWALSHSVALEDCKKYGIPVIRYEDLYGDPFNTVKQIVRLWDLKPRPMHPSYLFSPSLTTNKTFHGIYSVDKQVKRGDFSFFWNRTLSAYECSAIEEIVTAFGLQDHLVGTKHRAEQGRKDDPGDDAGIGRDQEHLRIARRTHLMKGKRRTIPPSPLLPLQPSTPLEASECAAKGIIEVLPRRATRVQTIS